MKIINILLLVSVFSACDGGGDASNDLPQTVAAQRTGDVCEVLVASFCGRISECGSAPTCESSLYASCCGTAGTCGALIQIANSTVDACTSAYENQTCAQVLAGNVPVVCNSIPL